MEDQAVTGEPQISAEIDSDIAETYRQVAKERGYHFSTFEWLAVHDPATGSLHAEVAAGDARDVERAVAAARAAVV